MNKIYAPLLAAVLLLSGCSAGPTPGPFQPSSAIATPSLNSATPSPIPTPTFTKPTCQNGATEGLAKAFYKFIAVDSLQKYYEQGRYEPIGTIQRLSEHYSPTLVAGFIVQASSWPIHVEVLKEIVLGRVEFQSDCTTVLLYDTESWTIVSAEAADKGAIKLQELGVSKVIKIEKAGYSWIVSSITNLPQGKQI